MKIDEIIMEGNVLKEKLFWKMENESGCPVCSLLMSYEFDLLASMQYDITNNDSLRKQIAMEGGFCDFHFRQFKKIANYKTNILLLKAIVDAGMHKNVNVNIDCRLCNAVNQFENELVHHSSELFSDIDFQDRFKKSNGLCIIHLKEILVNINEEGQKNMILKIHHEQIDRFKPLLEMMSSARSYFDIDINNRELVNVLIQKFAGRKTAGF